MEWGANLSVCRKSFAFSQTVCLFQMEKRASPLFQAFFPLQLVFFLNQAAVFRQSQRFTPDGMGREPLLFANKKHCPRENSQTVPFN